MNAQTQRTPERCYICGKPLADNIRATVYLEDDGNRAVPVGMGCYRRTIAAGYDGVQSGSGKGPRVFVEKRFAENYPAYRAALAKVGAL